MNRKTITVVFRKENTPGYNWSVVGTGSGRPDEVLSVKGQSEGSVGPSASNSTTVSGYPAYYAYLTPSGNYGLAGSGVFTGPTTFVFGAKITAGEKG